MQVTNLNYPDLLTVQNQLDLSNRDPSKTLIQIFSGLKTEQELSQLIAIIKSKNSDIKFLGATTAGEIYNGETSQNSINLSIMEFEQTTFENKHFDNKVDFDLGIDIAKSLFKAKTKAMILFIEGLLKNGHDVVEGVASINPNIPIAGGMAGDNGAFVKTYVFDNEGVYENGAVAVAFNSDTLKVFTDYQLNWQTIGKEMCVTKAKKNRLYEIEGMPAAQMYKKYLGAKVYDGLPHSAIEFPMLKIEKNGLEVCRTFVHKFDEDDSLLTIGNLNEGDKIKLAFGNVNLIVNNSANNVERYDLLQPQAIYTYSCASRLTFLQSDVVIELEPLNNIAPISGFFTYGEIFHKDGKNTLLNISLTLLGFSEETTKKQVLNQQQKPQQDTEKNFFKDKHFIVLDALTNLSNEVILELNETKKEIEVAHRHIKESINYASMLQDAIVSKPQELNAFFRDSFVIWEPKDTVGGDIWLFNELRHKDECLLFVIDCTGHGVPGAFVTMIVRSVEKELVTKLKEDPNLDISPAWIMSYFNKTMKILLKQDNPNSKSNAGWDGAIIYYNKKEQILKFSGAETPLFYVDEEGNFQYQKGTRYSVGYKKCDMDYVYEEIVLDVKEGMKFYFTTDGYLDQNGGDKGFPFGKNRFRKIIEANHTKSMDEQKNKFMGQLKYYEKIMQENSDRNDDITVVAITI